MKQKIKIADFIKSVADMTLETGVLSKGLKTIEKAGQFKLEGSNITELIIAEIFVSQISLNQFLKSKNRIDLLDLYFAEIYYLLSEKYKYFKFKEELRLFETLIQARFPEYYEILDNPNDTFVALGGTTFKKLSSKESIWPLFPMTLGMILGNKMITLNNFIKEVSEKFEIEINL